MNDLKAYNLIFPLWLVAFLPPFVFGILLGNLIIDGLVITLTLKKHAVKLEKWELRILILKAWGLGFLSDIIGVMILLGLTSPLSVDEYNPWVNPGTFSVYLFVVAAVGVIIYLFNVSLCKKQGDIPPEVANKVGMAMGFFTAPWLFFIPTPF
jgi:hypothetical protein